MSPNERILLAMFEQKVKSFYFNHQRKTSLGKHRLGPFLMHLEHTGDQFWFFLGMVLSSGCSSLRLPRKEALKFRDRSTSILPCVPPIGYATEMQTSP